MDNALDIKTYAYTDKGGRERNEDYYGYYWEAGAGCWVVADGLGGHSGGEVASRFVTEALIERSGIWTSFSDDEIIRIVIDINDALLASQLSAPENKGMKTTLAAVFAENGVMKFIHAGDSRLYYFRNNRIIICSKDHSMSQRAVDAGEIRFEDIRFHEERNIVLKVMGLENLNLTGMVGTIRPEPGDAFLLCSDGFWEYVVEDEMISELSKAAEPYEWLMGMLNAHRGKTPANNDNYTAVCSMVSAQLRQDGWRRQETGPGCEKVN